MSPHMHITDQSLHAATKGATVDEILVDSDASAESTPAPISQTTGQTTPAEIETLPYWLVNVPQEQWPAECPEWLHNLEPRAIEVLSTLDGAYKKHDWEMVKETIKTNHLEHFQRLPSDLRKYLEYMFHIKKKYGSVMSFVVKERLCWGEGTPEDLKPKGRPFEFDEDLKILLNDWPYGVENGIVHMVVWTKFELAEDPDTGDLTDAARKEIDDYVQKTFCTHLSPERVVWFKNWRALKSIHAVEHFHVLLNNPDMEFVKEITHGDIPLVEKVSGKESHYHH